MSSAPQPQPWVDGLTIGQAFARTAQQHPDQLAAAFTALDDRKTWSELEEIVARAAKGLLALGISKGDHVAVWATNVPHWVSLQVATARIGAVLVTVNPAYRPFELQYVLKQSDAAALFLVDRFKSSDYFEMLAEILPELAAAGDGPVESEQFPKLRRVVTMQGDSPPGALSWEEMTRLGEDVEDSALRQAEHPLDPD
ncbi:MAG: AMP-binding protein, partial [Planctomycetales bacterium]